MITHRKTRTGCVQCKKRRIKVRRANSHAIPRQRFDNIDFSEADSQHDSVMKPNQYVRNAEGHHENAVSRTLSQIRLLVLEKVSL